MWKKVTRDPGFELVVEKLHIAKPGKSSRKEILKTNEHFI